MLILEARILDTNYRGDLDHARAELGAFRWAIQNLESPTAAIDKAVALAVRYGGIDGEHHKAWVIDQIVRLLTGDEYEMIVSEACDGEDGPETYSWEVGIPP